MDWRRVRHRRVGDGGDLAEDERSQRIRKGKAKGGGNYPRESSAPRGREVDSIRIGQTLVVI